MATAVLTFALLAPTPAQASTPGATTGAQPAGTSDFVPLSDSCSFGGQMCLYKHATYPTNSERRVVPIFQDFLPSYTGFRWDGTSAHMNDQLTSLQGHRSGVFVLFEHSNRGGRSLGLGAGVWPSTLSAHNFNDITSSHVW